MKKPAVDTSKMGPEEIALRKLGAEKKLWRIEVYFLDEKLNDLKRHYLNNQTSQQVFAFRGNIFSTGLMIPIDPGHWRVFPPSSVIEIHLWQQQNFFEP